MRAVLAAGLVAAGCATADPRPLIENASSQVLELRSTHQDGRTFTAILQPGTQIALGTTEVSVQQLEGRTDGEEVLSLSRSEIEACLEEQRDRCLGWRLDDSGLAKLSAARSDAEPSTTERQ